MNAKKCKVIRKQVLLAFGTKLPASYNVGLGYLHPSATGKGWIPVRLIDGFRYECQLLKREIKRNKIAA